MSTVPPPPTGAAQPLQVIRRWDESAETRYALTGAPPSLGALGTEFPATAVDPGGVVRNVRVVVLPPSEAGELRGRVHENLVALGALRNPNLGAGEATVEVEGGWGLVVPAHDGRQLDDLLEGGPLPARASAELVLEVAWGLAAAHAAVVPDQIRPTAFPHGRVDAGNVSVSGLAEVVLDDYNLHAARAVGSSVADDVFAIAQLFVQLVDGEPMPALPADPSAARRALEEDLRNLRGITDEMRSLITEMLEPDPARRPDVRSVARRLRRLIPQQEGLWLSAWAESTIGVPERERPTLVMPTPALVREEAFSDEVPQAASDPDGPPRVGVDETPPLIKKGRKGEAGVQLRFGPMAMGIGVVLVLMSLVGSVQVARWWLDGDGPMDLADVPTDQAGPDQAAAAGPRSSSGKERGPDDPPPSGADAPPVTIIEAEAGLEPVDEGEERRERELVDSDEAIDTEKAPTSPIDDGSTAARAEQVGSAEPDFGLEVGPPPWPRPAGTLGEHDLFVEVPLADGLEVRCTNGLSMRGPSRFRAAIMQSTSATCVITATLRGGRTATSTVELDRTRDLICRHGFHETLRCAPRQGQRSDQPEPPPEATLDSVQSDIRVRIPLAQTVDVVCGDGTRDSGVDVEWIALNGVAVGTCRVDATMPDGRYAGAFHVTQNAELICLRDFSGTTDGSGRRPLRCAEATAL